MITNIDLNSKDKRQIIGNLKIKAQENMKEIVDKLIRLGYTTSQAYSKRHIFVYSHSKNLTMLPYNNMKMYNEHANIEISKEYLLAIPEQYLPQSEALKL